MILQKNLLSLLIVPIISSVLFADAKSSEQSFNNGKKIYEATCVSCHGENGETNLDMHLIVKPRKLNQTILTQ